MGRKKLSLELKKSRRYNYDYPENRKIGTKLISGDLKFIAGKTGYTSTYISQILRKGIRNNERVKTIALKLIELREGL
ncbi:MAG: hypothetical protein M0Q38_10300 [Bacteroidales bacterium]|jgi:hypothetical protein|nr:hypothetical protein [Bacteroidales bacterium]